MASISRSSFLLKTRVWPTWVPDAIAETQRRAFISQLQPVAHRQSSFHFSACLQTIFSIQDSILGIQNPLQLQQARAYSQHSVARRRALSLLPASPIATGSSPGCLEHVSARPRRSMTAPGDSQSARAEKFETMKSRILSVL